MKNKNLFFKIYITFLIIFIAALFIISILGKKTRVGYLGEFKFDEYHINRTLELNGLIDVKENYKIDGKLDKEALINFIFTNEYITNYSYGFRLQYYNKVFKNSDIYGVYVDTNKVLKDNPFIKEMIMNEGGSPFGDLVSVKKIDFEKIDNINYILKVKYNVFKTIIILFVLVLMIKYILTLYLKVREYEITDNKYTFSKKDYNFIILSSVICIILFIFEYWLFYPGYFQLYDTWQSIAEGVTGIHENWHPILIGVNIKVLKIFNYNMGIILFINLFIWYIGLFLYIFVLYIRSKNKIVLLLYLLVFFSPLLFGNITYMKDYVASIYVWTSYSIIFFLITIKINNKYILFVLRLLSFLFLMIGMLSRHNFIVTIYPIFILISYNILRNIKKLYLLHFISLMGIFAIILIFTMQNFPKMFIKYEWQLSKNSSYHIFLSNIAACSVPANDGSLIPNNWYKNGYSFDDVKLIYEKYPTGADYMREPTNWDNINKSDLRRVWIKYIIKYPFNYIKHIFLVFYKYFTIEYNEKINLLDIQKKDTIPDLYRKGEVEHYFSNQGITFNTIKERIYSFLLFASIKIHISVFIIISTLSFMLSILILFKCRYINNLSIFYFSVSFSSFATLVIVVLFTPLIDYRYIYPIIPLSIITIMSFISIIYDIGGIKKFIKEFRGNK